MFTVGRKFIYVTSHRWSGNYGKDTGTEVRRELCEVTAVKADLHPPRFEYKVTDVLGVDNPLPGTERWTLSADRRQGGMSIPYAESEVRRGSIRLV